tara:strand:- start:2619 stop:3467 length:849 start_codon:yes stop_codon:yes gene_type:complete
MNDLLGMYEDGKEEKDSIIQEMYDRFMTPANRLLNGAINDKEYKEQSALLNAIREGALYGENGKNLYGESSEAVADSLQSFGGKVGWLESDNIIDRVQEPRGPGRGKYQYEMNVFTGGLEDNVFLPQGAALTGHRTGENIHTNYGIGVVKEGSPEHKALLKKQNNKNYNPQGGAETAVRRLKNAYEAYGLEMSDDWKTLLNMSELDEPSYNIDFSTLPENLQDELFYADKQQDPDFKLLDLSSGELSMKNAWLDYHWSGSAVDRESKANYFDRKMKDYKGQR